MPVTRDARLQSRPLAFAPRHKYHAHVNELRFEWDANKDKSNVKKHGVAFEEARVAFYDENAIQFYDPDHSKEEHRFILLGLSFKPQVLVVCHCFTENETIIRIISARKADKDEEREYWKQRK
ncbi:MAG: BrnT family toxin [Methylococcaceae bacterium]|nr:BrnT family toxin [Methylococcaceae bacterium]